MSHVCGGLLSNLEASHAQPLPAWLSQFNNFNVTQAVKILHDILWYYIEEYENTTFKYENNEK